MDIKQGEIVTLKHYTGNYICKGVIESIRNAVMSIKAQKECAVYSYFTNDPVVIGYLTPQEKMFLFECTIQSINYDNNSIDVKIEDVCAFNEKRQNTRYPTSIYGVIKQSQSKGTIYIKNISSDGMSIKSKSAFDEGQEIEVEAYINKVLLNVKATVSWKRHSASDLEYGLEITDTQQPATGIIENYIDSIKDNYTDALSRLNETWDQLSTIRPYKPSP